MGRQIGFYTTMKDDLSLAKLLREEFDCTLVASGMSKPDAPEPIVRLTQMRVARAHKQNLIILVPTELLTKLKINVYRPGNCRIDDYDSPVIVWNRCMPGPDCSLAGRFWYEASRPGNKMKNKVFLAWAGRVFRLVRRLFEKHPKLSRHYLIGPDFLKQLNAGRVRIDLQE